MVNHSGVLQLVLVDGPSCGGKSTVADALWERRAGWYLARGDRIKWLISGYQSERHRPTVDAMLIATARVALKQGMSVIVDGPGLCGPGSFMALAREFGLQPVVVEVTAAAHVLHARFDDRVAAARASRTPTATGSRDCGSNSRHADFRGR
jgi:predicted kinase